MCNVRWLTCYDDPTHNYQAALLLPQFLYHKVFHLLVMYPQHTIKKINSKIATNNAWNTRPASASVSASASAARLLIFTVLIKTNWSSHTACRRQTTEARRQRCNTSAQKDCRFSRKKRVFLLK